MTQLFYVFLGGGLGSVARHLVSLAMANASGTALPYATLTVNGAGSFLISLIMHVALSTGAVSADARLFLTTGVMGGLTTYSAFNYETLSRFQDGAWLMGTLNLVLTVAVCLVLGLLGLVVGRAISGPLRGAVLSRIPRCPLSDWIPNSHRIGLARGVPPPGKWASVDSQ